MLLHYAYNSPLLAGAFLWITMAHYSPFSLGKTERLKSRKAIDLLFEKGRTYTQFPIKMIWLLQPGDEPLQAGFTVSSRLFKKATNRNRIKRLLREAYRLQKQELAQTLQTQNKSVTLFFLYQHRELPNFDTIYLQMGRLLAHLIKKMNENDQ